MAAGLLHHPAAAAAAACGALEGTAIPQYRSILLWLGATLDSHMVALSMHAACHQVSAGTISPEMHIAQDHALPDMMSFKGTQIVPSINHR